MTRESLFNVGDHVFIPGFDERICTVITHKKYNGIHDTDRHDYDGYKYYVRGLEFYIFSFEMEPTASQRLINDKKQQV